MKYILFFFPLFCFSQHLVKNDIDEFTGDRRVQVNCYEGDRWATSDRITKGFGNYVYLTGQYIKDKEGNELYFLTLNIHNLPQGSCLSQYDGKIIWLFNDKSTLELPQISETDCEYTSINGKYKLTLEQVETLKTKQSDKLRVYTTKGYLDFELKDDKKELMQKTFETLVNTVQNL